MSQTLEQGPQPQPEPEEKPVGGPLSRGRRWRTTAARPGSVAVAVLVLAAVGGGAYLVQQHRAETARPAVLEQAKEACAPSGAAPGISLEDEGRTLLVDTEGDEDTSGASIVQLVCVLDELDTPSSVIARMDSTRALDGRQDGSWDDIEASWGYHPNTGLDVILTVS